MTTTQGTVSAKLALTGSTSNAIVGEYEDASYWGYEGPDGQKVAATVVYTEDHNGTRYHMIKVPELGLIETRVYVGDTVYRTVIEIAAGRITEYVD